MAQKMMKRMPSGLEEGIEKMSPTEELALEHGQLTRILLAMVFFRIEPFYRSIVHTRYLLKNMSRTK
jgi:hypothetical protein